MPGRRIYCGLFGFHIKEHFEDPASPNKDPNKATANPKMDPDPDSGFRIRIRMMRIRIRIRTRIRIRIPDQDPDPDLGSWIRIPQAVRAAIAKM